MADVDEAAVEDPGRLEDGRTNASAVSENVTRFVAFGCFLASSD